MILLRSFLSGHIRIKRTREYYDAGIGPNVPFGAIGFSPVVSQNFLTNTTVPSWMDVSATTGNRMLYDSTGKLTWAPNNLLTYSEQFNNAVWTKNLGGVGSVPVVTPDAGTAPDGTTTADRIVFTLNGGTAAADVSDVRHAPTTIASKYIFSFWIRSFDGVSSYNMLLRDVNGFVNSIAVSGTWTRVSTVATYAAGTSTIGFGIRGGQTPVNPNTADVLVWGAQLEAVTYQTTPSTYNATTTAAYYGPRFDYDPSTLAAKGLLVEESRANIALQSNTFNTTWGIISIAAFGSGSVLNATTSPDGNTNAAQLTAAAATASHYMSQNITWTAAIYTVSFYVKRNTQQYVQITTWDGTVTRHMNFDILNGTVGTGSNSTGSITNIGNGWYRVSMTTSTAQAAAAGNTTLAFSNSSSASSNPNYATTGTESFFVYGCQIEAGSFATSYIPTTTASVTRAADIIKLSGAALTTLQGSAVSALVQTTPWAASSVLTSYGTLGAGSSARLIYGSASGNTIVQTFNGTAATTATIGGGATVNGSITRVGVSWLTAGGANSVSLVANNGTVGNSAATFTIGASVYLGAYSSGGGFGGCVQSIAIYNQRLPNATLQSKSVVGSPL